MEAWIFLDHSFKVASIRKDGDTNKSSSYVRNVSMEMEVIILRPIWSSLVPFRNRDYNIGDGIKKRGVTHLDVPSTGYETQSSSSVMTTQQPPSLLTQSPTLISSARNPSVVNNNPPARPTPTLIQNQKPNGRLPGSGPNQNPNTHQYPSETPTTFSNARNNENPAINTSLSSSTTQTRAQLLRT
uniref:AlNc14C47G3793 protein n=1 Tax=Albugo laibachii Nc14 TaxID=890382 RepID=F0WAT0_9STRA|nr:AlNc14C47G3793 [Albugo laibachii Nc14]|eukprot:CCA18252.1 AlNc14C47G3793 [Albugo laibachii Nc14]